jgi:hypothetical protein
VPDEAFDIVEPLQPRLGSLEPSDNHLPEALGDPPDHASFDPK